MMKAKVGGHIDRYSQFPALENNPYQLASWTHCEKSLPTPAMASLPVAQVLGLIFTSCAAVGFPDMSKELVMGNRGPVGLAWASTTTVGSLAAMKTCLAAAAPGWLREDFLLRDPTIDTAIGLTSNVSRPSKRRKNRAKALGIVSKRQVLPTSLVA